jgi:membrane-bound lytic murein transglycosylase D
VCYFRLFIAALLCLLVVVPARAAPLAVAARPPENMTLCGERVPWELDDVRERFELEMLLGLNNRAQVLLWLKRAPRYLPHIARELEKAGMPDDLKYLPIVESALRPHATSRRGAVGFWQMMPETARNNGLTVDRYIDERRDFHASTRAALQYLQALYDQFSSWTLALAAYNMGRNGLDAEILEQNISDYYRLHLPLETQRFVFRLLVVKRIVEDPAAFGFELALEDAYRPPPFDTVTVDLSEEVPIRLVAEAAGTYFKAIKDLNPHLRGHYIQAGQHAIRLPEGAADRFDERLAPLVASHARHRRQRIYVVQGGDSLSTIAERFNVPLAALLIWNRLDMNKPIHPGDRLVVFSRPEDPVGPLWPDETIDETGD